MIIFEKLDRKVKVFLSKDLKFQNLFIYRGIKTEKDVYLLNDKLERFILDESDNSKFKYLRIRNSLFIERSNTRQFFIHKGI